MNLKDISTKTDALWQSLIQTYQLSQRQVEQFKQYLDLLVAWNKTMNITAIEETPDILTHHFQDSLEVAKVVAFKDGDVVCDVGSGGGFPGIPLKILLPHVHVILLEVNNKKVSFLKTVIEELGLTGIETNTLDWRSFLRKGTHHVDYFLARASLKPADLTKLFQPGYRNKTATLIYWASKNWQMEPDLEPFFIKETIYSIDSKKRRLIFFAKK